MPALINLTGVALSNDITQPIRVALDLFARERLCFVHVCENLTKLKTFDILRLILVLNFILSLFTLLFYIKELNHLPD